MNVLEWGETLLRGATLSNACDRIGKLRGNAVAIEVADRLALPGYTQEHWRYTDLARFVGEASLVLQNEGVRPDDRVVLCTGNGLDMPLLALAVIRCGAQVVPVNAKARPDELGFMIRDSKATHLIVDPVVLHGLHDHMQGDRGDFRALKRLIVGGGIVGGSAEACSDAHDRGVALSIVDLDAKMQAVAGVAVPAPVKIAPDAVCAIFYTSGTTGFPKGAMLTSRSLLQRAQALMMLPRLPMVPIFRVLIALPAAHIMGFVAVLLPMLSGLTLRYRARFDASDVLDDLEMQAIDAFVGVPSMYQMLLQAGAQQRDLRGVKVFASGADVMPGELIRVFKGLGRILSLGPLINIPAIFAEAYGSVELSGAAMVRISLPWVEPSQGGFVGMPLPGYRARVVDAATCKAVKRGTVGELQVRGPGVLQGYLGQASDAIVEGGWLRTGDMAARTRLGFVKFVGRDKDMIKSGGYSVFPAEIETRLLEHPMVEIASVVGVAHKTRGAVPVAVVVLGEQVSPDRVPELEAWITQRVASYKVPRRIVVVQRDELPYGPTGKIVKRKLVGLVEKRDEERLERD